MAKTSQFLTAFAIPMKAVAWHIVTSIAKTSDSIPGNYMNAR